MTSWQKAYSELEDQIHDLPRWVHKPFCLAGARAASMRFCD
jgi:hypothetical protein